MHQSELDEFLDRVPSNILVVIDEAYVEFDRDPLSVRGMDTYRNRPNVAVLRTFSKAYGLAGMRVGFCIAHTPVADALRPGLEVSDGASLTEARVAIRVAVADVMDRRTTDPEVQRTADGQRRWVLAQGAVERVEHRRRVGADGQRRPQRRRDRKSVV